MPSPPSAVTSSKAAVYSALSSAGGGGTRNWSADASTNGVTSPQCAPSATGSWLIGSCRQTPGASPGT